MKSFVAWVSHTCYVCSQTCGPKLHVSSRGYRPTSPCDTLGIVIKAHCRKEAKRQARQVPVFRRYLQK